MKTLNFDQMEQVVGGALTWSGIGIAVGCGALAAACVAGMGLTGGVAIVAGAVLGEMCADSVRELWG